MSSNMHFKSPIPIENAGQITLVATSVLCIAITCLLVGLRVFARFKVSKRLDASDYCILIALFFNTALHTDVLVMVRHGGFGFHVQDIATRFGPGVVTIFFQGIMSFALLWNATTCFTKISILLIYASLFPVNRLIAACRVTGVLIVLWNIGGILGGVLICRPFAMNWDTTIPGGSCGNQPLYYLLLGVINILAEGTLLVMPIPVLYHLRMPLRKKMVIIGMFSVGLATCAVTIYRQVLLPGLDFADMPYSGLKATVFSGLEPSIALALACVPFLRPYFGSTFRSPKNTSYNLEGSKSQQPSKRSGGSRRFQVIAVNDNASYASDLQLQPMKGVGDTHIAAEEGGGAFREIRSHSITVHKEWEVRCE
ncbi:integral membrane protein [Xylariomycetidae sp. FL2044]|nr:integral membrane protein [Xylariomycetidae sp. FL2044]